MVHSLKLTANEPENGWLEYYFPLGRPIFRGELLVLFQFSIGMSEGIPCTLLDVRWNRVFFGPMGDDVSDDFTKPNFMRSFFREIPAKLPCFCIVGSCKMDPPFIDPCSKTHRNMVETTETHRNAKKLG